MPLWEKSQQTLRGKLDGRDPTLGEKNSLRNAEVVRLVVIQWPAGIVPSRQQGNRVRVKPRILERVHALDDFLFLKVDHGHRTVAHPWQVQQGVLHEGVMLVGREADMMRAFGDWDRLDQLGLFDAAAHIEDVQISGLRRRDIETVPLAVKIDLQRHAAPDAREVECLRCRKNPSS